jgi:hypothetical protein
MQFVKNIFQKQIAADIAFLRVLFLVFSISSLEKVPQYGSTQ